MKVMKIQKNCQQWWT
uniref:Truncated envelope glycoprotein n=1 Tax=Human immunodeficiency virus type 1 TaxID=11676 RepID=Q3S5G4_HV1|nr:truncated envelope glycoprotein [Human immunodeficiency virus 1]